MAHAVLLVVLSVMVSCPSWAEGMGPSGSAIAVSHEAMLADNMIRWEQRQLRKQSMVCVRAAEMFAGTDRDGPLESSCWNAVAVLARADAGQVPQIPACPEMAAAAKEYFGLTAEAAGHGLAGMTGKPGESLYRQKQKLSLMLRKGVDDGVCQ